VAAIGDFIVTETIASIVAAHITGTIAPADTVARSFARIRAHGDAAVFISLRDESAALAEAKALAAAGPQDRPLYGVPVAIKDNIDVEGLPTTAACPAFAYNPGKDATVVAQLKRARSSLEKPISISSQPGWSACVRPMAFHATRLSPS